MEQTFDRDAVGRALGEERGQPAVNVQELLGERRDRRGRDGPADDDAVARSVGLHAPVPGAIRTGVDAENPHASEASISFSSISKFDHTWRTSSCSSRASMSLTI